MKCILSNDNQHFKQFNLKIYIMQKIILFLLFCSSTFAQSPIFVDDIQKMNDSVFRSVSEYKVIWMGEMHGAKEPALITEGFVNLLLKNNKNVTLALEIPQNRIINPNKIQDSTSLAKSDFFKNGNFGNRSTKSWFNLALKFANEPRVSIIYFDQNIMTGSNTERDSLMAVNLLRDWHQNTTLVVLSGNLHNMLELSSRGQKKAALYLSEISNNSVTKNDILSLNHLYVKGQIMTSYAGDGLKLTDFDYSKSVWANDKIHQKDHLMIFPDLQNGWRGHFFTRLVNVAEIMK